MSYIEEMVMDKQVEISVGLSEAEMAEIRQYMQEHRIDDAGYAMKQLAFFGLLHRKDIVRRAIKETIEENAVALKALASK